MRSAMIGCALLAFAVTRATWAQRSPEPPDGIAAVGDSARSAWAERDFARLFIAGARVQLRLPDAHPSAGVGSAQAVILLRDYVRGTSEISVEVVRARAVGTTRAFVDLERRFRPDGTQEARVESVLLGYRRAERGWRLVDLRVLPGP